MAQEFKTKLTVGQFNKGISRALNRTIEKTRTAAYRKIREFYNIPVKNLRNDISIVRASPTLLSAKLNALGRPIPLIVFQARQTKRGVTANIAKNRVLIRHAFIAKMQSGHRGVFARGAYDGSKFAFRHERVKEWPANDLVINELLAKSVPSALMNTTILESMKRGIERDLPGRMRHELQYILGKVGR